MANNNSNNISRKFYIKFTVGAFDKEIERSGIYGCKKYTKHVAEMNKAAEVLDRYDDFSSLTLLPSDYAQTTTEYGIPKQKFHTGNERLLPHQAKATQAFLKELRGFGLLADVVGSGKTYEACSVLSELAAKGKINSMLLIVPSQVYNTWIGVLEMGFGLGKGQLKTLDADFDDENFVRGDDGVLKPKQPLIVKTEDFVKWKEHDVDNVLFDVVVVDEAHNLCGEEGASAKALKLLSILMATKKKAKKTYCLLLSATPHSGNLSQMFRLWYFIRCKGGTPDDFDEKDDVARTDVYRKEKSYYQTYICRGATTVMEFINKVKLMEVSDNFGAEFEDFLETRNINNFQSLLDGEKKKIVEDFMFENEENGIAGKIKDNIAKAYHNGVLRSIMIRQPNDRIRKGKRIENVFFFPATNKAKEIAFKGLNQENLTLHVDNFGKKGAITTREGSYSIEEYIQEHKGNMQTRQAYAALFLNNGILNAFGLDDKDFQKKNSIQFYWRQLSSRKRTVSASTTVSDEDVAISFRPVFENKVFESKLKELKEILTKHKDGRVIVFFDYDIKKSQRCYEEVLAELKKDPAFASRIIIGDNSDKSIIEKKFNEKQDTILVVTDNAFTEGANLQKSNVIVNFQVTPNPLAMEQRIGRIFRLGQENDVTIYSLADMRELEGYVLMYFTNIGLMTSNSGDAAIIAGSNNDNMVTIRCSACGSVKLIAREDYEAYIKNDSDEIYCADNPKCTQDNKRGTLMSEINGNEVKCDNCGNVIKRQNSDDGGQYYCLSVNNTGSGVMCNVGEKGDRQLYCRKICAISHCERFTYGAMKGKCEALDYYLKNPSASDSDLEEICYSCKFAGMCLAKCKIGSGVDAIRGCMNCGEASCFPKPHVVNFDDKWEADCPVCKSNGLKGKLKPVVARTFETYIRSAYDYQQDGGKSFCDNLAKESEKVSLIQEILSNDKVSD